MAKSEHLHFLGIGGHTMRGVADAALRLGHTVTGTDEGAYPPGSDWLDERGITWWRKAAAAHLDGVDRIIISGHVPTDHPELAVARQRHLPILSFAELVAELTASARRIVVAGTHGKTTTTSLITWIFEFAGRKPDFLIGIQPHNFDSSVRLAGSGLAVIEGDEYRASQLDDASKFAYYRPDELVVTSLELDHPDFFTDLADISGRFASLINGLPAGGTLYYWRGSEAVRELAEPAPGARVSYDFVEADWWADDVRFKATGLRFRLHHHREDFGELRLPLYGRHNVLNALAAAAVTLGSGVSFADLAEALRTFRGASRRFQPVGPASAAVRVIDDYAHHPTEVATTVEAAKLHFPGRVIAVFRPHTYSRTEKLLKEYQSAFDHADRSFIAEIEAAREYRTSHRVSGADIADGAAGDVRYEPDRAALLTEVAAAAEPGDTVLCMSVNGYEGFAEELAERLAKQ